MGIKNIFRLVKDHAPHAVREVKGWEELAGSRLAFDGTLMLMRLHYAPSESPNRHMLGLSSLLRQLRSHQIQPVFVFDNPEPTARVPEKLREHQKRKLHRARLLLRIEEENKRRKRIAVIKQLVPEWADMDERSRLECARYLQQWSTPGAALPWQVQSKDASSITSERSARSKDPRSSARLSDSDLKGDLEALKRLAARLGESDGTVDATPSVIGGYTAGVSGLSSTRGPVSQGLIFAKRILQLQIDFLEAMCTEISMDDDGYLEDLAASKPMKETPRQRLLSYTEGQMHGAFQAGSTSLAYSASKRLIETSTSTEEDLRAALESPLETQQEPLSPDVRDSTRDVGGHGFLEDVVAEDEAVSPPNEEAARKSTDMGSRSSDALPKDIAVDAPKVQPAVITKTTSEQDRSLTTLLQEMTHVHDAMTTGYKRATRPLPPNLSQTAAELCSLHGVPVVWTGSGVAGVQRPGEAEALCAEIVKQGFADAVVSEDSDTLLYDVPMIRGALGGPLQMIDAKAVRRAFFPAETLAVAPAPAQIAEIGADSPSADGVASIALASAPNDTWSLEADAESAARFLELALLCGTDFNRTIPSISIKRGLRFIREYARIERILQPVEGDAELLRAQPADKDAALPPEQAKQNKVIARMAKFMPPDGLTIAEYKQELNIAKRVLRRRPTLHRDKKTLQAWSSAPRSTEWNPTDGEALAEFWKRQHVADADDAQAEALLDYDSNSDEVDTVRRGRRGTPGTFGKNMFDDSPSEAQQTASWSPETR